MITFSGVGLRLGPRDGSGNFHVDAVFPFSPAEVAGIKPGCELIAIGMVFFFLGSI